MELIIDDWNGMGDLIEGETINGLRELQALHDEISEKKKKKNILQHFYILFEF